MKAPHVRARRILHHGPRPGGDADGDFQRVVEGCWFELSAGLRGGGELSLKDDFLDRNAIEIGDWIS
ncbi:MAG: hypothetical protein U0992_00740 [Planctomycetaceae bacterium]